MNANKLVRDLGHPQYGPIAQALLVAEGPAAVPALAACLLGPPGPEPEARRLVARALGAIGGEEAFAALIAALSHNARGLSGQAWLDEQAVRDAVAEELLRLGDRRAIEPLLRSLQETHLPAAARALAAFREIRALPAMVEVLEDNFVSERIADAILAFGLDAVPDLLETLAVRRPRNGPEAGRGPERGAPGRCPTARVGSGHPEPSGCLLSIIRVGISPHTD